MGAFVRAVRFEVVLDIPHKPLWELSGDLTVAANRAISTGFMLQIGHLPRPMVGEKPTPDQTLAYQLLTGAWCPVGRKPAYRHPPGSGMLAEVANMVQTRLATDRKAIFQGKSSLATFRSLPLCYRAKNLRWVEAPAEGKSSEPGGQPVKAETEVRSKITDVLPMSEKNKGRYVLRLTTFGKDAERQAIHATPAFALDRHLRVTLDRIQSGQYVMGSAKLSWEQREGRRGKWVLSLSWSDPARQTQELQEKDTPLPQGAETLTAGVDIGIRHAAWVTFVTPDGAPVKRPEVIPWPGSTMRALARIIHDRRARGYYNHQDLGLREGRGRRRKLRVMDKHSHRVEEINHTMVRQVASLVIQACTKRGASLVVLEDHSKWSREAMLAKTDRLPKSEAAKIRDAYSSNHMGALREAIQTAAEAAGLQVVVVDPAWTSRTCHQCGLVYKRGWYDQPPVAGEVPAGRVTLESFECTPGGTEPLFTYQGGMWVEEPDRRGCGYVGQADHNAAINIARRGLARMADRSAWDPAQPAIRRPTRPKAA